MNHGYDSYKDIKETLQSMLDKGYTTAMIETVIEQNFNNECETTREKSILVTIRKEIEEIPINRDKYSQRQNNYCDGCEFTIKQILSIIDSHIDH